MAQRRRVSTTKKPAKRTKNAKGDMDPRWSILLFGIGLLVMVMAFIPGESFWAMLRSALFGVFGVCSYGIGPLLIYLAILVAKKQPFWITLAKAFLLMMFVSGTALVFSKVQTGQGFWDTIVSLYENGNKAFGGGLLSVVCGYTLLALCGRPVANIIVIVLLLMGVMLFTGITPLEIWAFFAPKLDRVQFHAQRTATAMAEQRAVRRAEREMEMQQQWAELEERKARLAEQQQQMQKFEQFHKIIEQDFETSNIAQQKVADEQGDVVIGPGGTFGMYPPPPTEQKYQEQKIPASIQSSPFDTEPIAQPNNEYRFFSDEEQELAPVMPQQTTTMQPEQTISVQPEETIAPQPMEQEQPTPEAQLTDLIYKAVTAGEKEAVLPLEETPEEKELLQSAPKSVDYQYPPIDLFKEAKEPDEQGVQEEMRKNADILVNTLDSFGVKTRILDISRGPAVTRYELQPLAGVKISKITGLSDDIALNLATAGVRIEAPIPGKPAVGVEIPNENRSTVSLRSILESQPFIQSKAPLTFALGKDITGNCQVGNLAKMPHLLIAGTTGSGKSVCTNSIILSFLYRCSPKVLRMILIDPKMVEFAHYNGIPHLLMPVVTEPRKAAGALGTAVAEMEKRYRLLADSGVPNIEEYNALAETDETLEKLPYIVIVIDELADLMMVAGKEVEDYICRLAQKARAAGMHLIIATQRPSVDVITGLIKANIPSRIALSVMSQIDSRTILDTAGAEKLLGYGDMLYMPVGVNKPVRVQGTFVSSGEIRGVIEFIRQNCPTDYDEEMIAEMEKRATEERKGESSSGDASSELDPMLKTAVEAVIDAGQASASLLQRRCKLGYARAARIMDEMEQLKIIGPYQGAKPRQVLITRQQWIEMTMKNDPVPEEL